MSWLALKKTKTIVYLSNSEYAKFVKQYADLNRWDADDLISFYIVGSKRNKEKKRINDFIIKSMTNEWKQAKSSFREKYSFAYHANAIEKHLYELIWYFCEFNPHFQMLINNGGAAYRPANVDINLSVTFGKDFYVGECYGLRKKSITERKYRIRTETITLIYGDMMDFHIGFSNGTEYRFHTVYDGRKTSGSISAGIGDLEKWKVLLAKAEKERLAQEKANAPSRIISTDEFQRKTLAFAKDACENYYEGMLEIEKDYEYYAMTPNIFVDFSVYEKKWSDLASRTKVRYDEVSDYMRLWDKQPNRDFAKTGLYGVMMSQTWSFYHSIFLYADDMAQMMHHLYEKAHGGKYSMKDYQKELQDTERRRPSDYAYNDVKKRYQDQSKCYQEQMNS